ncbi:MAG: PTS glucose transporter subunit IIA [Eubacteriales bacterium]
MNLFRKKSGGKFLSPVSGECVPLEDVKDEAFASKLCGDGIAVIPSENVFRSPVDGVLTGIAESKHAYTITSDDGLEVLVHIGIDTVELRGEGFTPKVSVGEKLKAGDVLCEADISFIKSKGYDTTSPAVISNIEELKSFRFRTGNVYGGYDTVIEYTR